MSVKSFSPVGASSAVNPANATTRAVDVQYLFERGIEPLEPGLYEPAYLPEAADLYPVELPAAARTDALLRPPSIDDWLHAAFRPDIADPMLLLPGNFREALQRALTQLKNAKKTKGSTAWHALEVLNVEEDLRDLLDYYRHALFQA
jgi:hypothetical protein